MKIKFIVFAILATLAMARISPNYSSLTPQPRHWINIPEGLIDYFVAIDMWLVGMFWKYIMYGTWYVLGEQVYCNFFPTIVADLLSTLSPDVDLSVTIPEADAKKACFKYFWVWYHSQFYEGAYIERHFAGIL